MVTKAWGMRGLLFNNKRKVVVIGWGLLVVVGVGVVIKKVVDEKIKGGRFKQVSEEYRGGKEAMSDVVDYKFVKYSLDSVFYEPKLPMYTLTIGEISNLKDFEKALQRPFSVAEKDALVKNNFFITLNRDKFWMDDLLIAVNRNDDWTYLYGKIGGHRLARLRKPENAVFISSDFLLHVYHRLLEKEIEYIEFTKFYPNLKIITDAMLNRAVVNYKNIKKGDKANRDSYQRIIAFLAVPKAILDTSYKVYSQYKQGTYQEGGDGQLDNKNNVLQTLDSLKGYIPRWSYEKAREELNLVLTGKEIKESPLFGKLLSEYQLQALQDYSQFQPRSHYSKNAVLRAYFRVMMWYGRNNFALLSPQLTRDALNISLLMKQTGQLKNWADIYIPTSFLVGQSDDLGLKEYVSFLTKAKVDSVNTQVVEQAQKAMRHYQGPKIQSSVFVGDKVFETTKQELLQKSKGFRFMGQRSTPDAFIFTFLTKGDEGGNSPKLPGSATALEVMSILGSKTADPLVKEWLQKEAPPETHSVVIKRINLLKDKFDKMDEEQWTNNIYWAWLYTIKSLFTEDMNKQGYPMFMRNEAWNKKELQAALGSWTELKHDSLLYSKQSYVEMGGGGGDGSPPPVPKGYVEPNIEFLNRLISLVQMTVSGLGNYGLLDGDFIGRNENLLKTLKFFRRIAIKEIHNEKISDDDFEELRLAGGLLDLAVLEPLPWELKIEKNARSALVADVHTDLLSKRVLYEGDGIPNYIWVAVKDVNGTRLTKGLVFSYHEFTRPLDQRLTDQDWWKLVYTTDKSQLPDLPWWVKSLFK